jgi:hypothetical protein
MEWNVNEHPSRPILTDPRRHMRDYQGFMSGVHLAGLATIVGVTFFTLAFCTSAGLGAAGLVALIEIAVGLYFARRRPKVSWQAEVANVFATTGAESGHEIVDGLLVRADGASAAARDPEPATATALAR